MLAAIRGASSIVKNLCRVGIGAFQRPDPAERHFKN
jgi:hypothetical protein